MLAKISYAEYSTIRKMSQKELSCFLNHVYKNAYEDGYKAGTSEPCAELYKISIAIRATEGIGEVLHKNIMDNIEKLCFGNEKKDV